MNTTASVVMKLRKFSGKTRHLNIKLALALLSFGALLSGQAWAYDQTTTNVMVGQIWTNGDGLSISFNVVPAQNLCNTGGIGYVRFSEGSASQEGIKHILASLTAAKLAGLTINVYAWNAIPGWCRVETIIVN